MIVTLENIQSVLAEIAVSRFEMLFTLEEALLAAFKCPDIPLCRFVLPEVPGKDFFGFTQDEWRMAFASPPFLHTVNVVDNGVRISFAKPARPKLVGRPSFTGDSDSDSDSRTLLVCLCWLYALENSFSLGDFCGGDRALITFLDDTHPSQEIIFHYSKVELSGPLDRFLPSEIRKALFWEDSDIPCRDSQEISRKYSDFFQNTKSDEYVEGLKSIALHVSPSPF
jgi:hypothetical protein